MTGEQHTDTVREALKQLDRERRLLDGRDYSESEHAEEMGALDALRDAQELRHWIERIKAAEKVDARFGLYIPGDSALAVVFGAMEEAAYAGDPEFDSRVREALRGGDAT
jgi:hypothetical protein